MGVNLASILLLLRWEGRMDPFRRTASGLALLLGIFALAIGTSLLPLAATPFFLLTLLLVALSGFASALCAGIFGLVNLYPSLLTSALTAGQGFGGLLPVAVDFALQRGTSFPPARAAALYFAFSLLLCLAAVCAFRICLWVPSAGRTEERPSSPLASCEESSSSNRDASWEKLDEDDVEDENRDEEEDQEVEEPIPVLRVARGIGSHIAAITANFVVTLALFPAITSAIASTAPGPPPDWFVPLHFLLFNLFDFLGRLLPSFHAGPPAPRVLFGVAGARVLFVPLFLLCHLLLTNQDGTLRPLAFPVVFGDGGFFLLVVLFAASNGWLSTCLFMSAPAGRAHKRTIGDLMVVSLACGLTLGSLLSFGIRALTCRCNPFLF
jgi:equilibrative nucleoside transporter 1/2/3